MPSIEATPPPVRTTTITNCPLCNAELDPSNPDECPKCDWVSGYRRRREAPVASGRDIAAVVMTVVPGLGHFYKGHSVMAALAFAGGVIAWIVAGVAATATMGFALALLPLYWVALMMHVFWLEDLAAVRKT